MSVNTPRALAYIWFKGGYYLLVVDGFPVDSSEPWMGLDIVKSASARSVSKSFVGISF